MLKTPCRKSTRQPRRGVLAASLFHQHGDAPINSATQLGFNACSGTSAVACVRVEKYEVSRSRVSDEKVLKLGRTMQEERELRVIVLAALGPST